MLEIKNLTKIYKPKKAEPVVALNNVSLTFNSTGLVFLLGKSGSGKSTLLNVLGGLDKFDSGEIIIDGRSSTTFKEKDFDAYRNTYLGFIFQEYNILPEFTVEKNIEFALELQGKKSDKQSVQNLLEQVDLKGYGKRKPNQLSGGQKQRIAIARALIKNPRIIMADEPTGALDSNTGKQVLDTLKKLSQEKLVIVVSHDREFAEYYADRIIELKDGAVISDTTKRQREPKDLGVGLQVVDEEILHIKKGHKYTKEDVLKVFDFLKNAKGDVILTADEKLNHDVRKLARIDEEGNREYFNNTTIIDIEKPKQENQLKLIKSKLKFKDSFKMGASGLKTKKFRLVITILLSAIALTLFGLADTMASFNVARSNYDSLVNMNTKQVSIDLRHVQGDNNYYYGEQENVGQQDLKTLKEKFPEHTFKQVYAVENNSLSYVIYDNVTNNYYYTTNLTGIASLTQKELETLHYSLYHEGGTQSKLPKKDDEVMLTKYQYDLIKQHGLRDKETNEKIEVRSLSDLVGQTISFEGKDYTVVGVLNGTIDENRYQRIKDLTSSYPPSNLYMLVEEYQTKLSEGFNNVFVFTEQEISNIRNNNANTTCIYEDNNIMFTLQQLEESEYYNYSSQRYYGFFGDEPGRDKVFFDSNKTSLNSDEVLVGSNVSIYINNALVDLRIKEEYTYDNNLEKVTYYVYKSNQYATLAEARAALQDDYRLYYASYGYPTITFYNHNKQLSVGTYKVVGFCFDSGKGYSSARRNALIFKDVFSAPKNLRYLSNEYVNITAGLLGSKSKDYDLIAYLSNYDSKEDALVIRSAVSGTLENFLDTINIMAKVFLYVGIGFAVFSALLLMNFITISISYKKKEIGILRALGARGSDVYGIFFNESLIITFINFIVSIGLTIGGVILINNLMVSNLGLRLTLLSFGIRQVILLGLVSLLVAMIASFLPTHRISKMKPIDAILDRKMK